MLGAALVAGAATVLYLPGLLLAWLLRFRGLTLFALAPALTIGLAGVSGPVLRVVGVPYTLGTFLGVVVVAAVGAWVLGHRVKQRRQEMRRPDRSDGTLLAALGAAAVVGVLPVAMAFEWRIDAISQSWDSPVHANLVAYIADTAVADWTVLTNLQAGGAFGYYPVGIHAVEALLVDLTGLPPAWVYNAFILLTPAHLALSAAAVARQINPDRVMAAAATAVAAVIPSFSLYFLLLSQPYAWSVVLVAAVLAAFLHAAARRTVAAFAGVGLGAAGLFSLQPSSVVAFVLLVLAWAAASSTPVRVRVTALVGLGGAGAAAILACLPAFLAGSRELPSVSGFDNKLELPLADIVAAPLTYGTASEPQWGVGIAAAAGVVIGLLRRSTRWVVLAHAVFVALYLTAHLASPEVARPFTGYWYNDPARLVMLFSLTAAVLVGAAAPAVVDFARRRSAAAHADRNARLVVVGLALAGLVAAAVYVPRNRYPVDEAYGNGPSLTYAQQGVLRRLPQWFGEGDRVVNDPWQGSVWMFAYSGVYPLVGRYGDPSTEPADLLLRHFDELERSSAVRDAVVETQACGVYVGQGSVVPKGWTWTGLDELDEVDDLELVYRDDQSRVYVLRGPLAEEAGCGPATSPPGDAAP